MVGERIDWRELMQLGTAKRVIKVMRQKGFVPIGRGVRVARCRCVLNRVVNQLAAAFEVDVSQMYEQSSSGQQKSRYVFIAASEDESDGWIDAINQCCTDAPARGSLESNHL